MSVLTAAGEQVLARACDFSLASLVAGYPDRALVEVLEEHAERLRGHAGLGPLCAARGDLAELQSTYIDLFDRGRGRVSLYETEHGRMRGLSKGHDLADIAGFYNAFGLTLDDAAAHEMLDHLAVELEFYAMLLCKQGLLDDRGDRAGGEIVAAARRSFMIDHLGRFVGTVARQPAVAAHPVFGPGLAWCAELVAAECASLGVVPAPLDFFADDAAERDDASCGAVRLPVVDA